MRQELALNSGNLLRLISLLLPGYFVSRERVSGSCRSGVLSHDDA